MTRPPSDLSDPPTGIPAVSPYMVLAWGILAVSTGAIFARLADASPIVIAAYRVGVATAVILPFALWRCPDEFRRLSGKDMGFAILAGFFLALHFAAWITSLDYTSVANSVVLANTNPMWVALLAPMITKDPIDRITLISVALSIVGGVIIGTGDLSVGSDALFGDILALVGGLCMAIYLLLGRNLRQKLSLLPYVSICYGSASLILWSVVLILGLPATGFSINTWGALLGVALIPQVLGHTSYNWVLKWLSTSLIAVSLLGEPIVSTIIAYFLFNEGLNLWKITGGAMILSAIYMAATRESKRKL